MYQDTHIIVSRYKGGVNIQDKSRADYFKERRKSKKTFYVELDKEKIESLESRLKEQDKSKTVWLEEKIDEELKK